MISPNDARRRGGGCPPISFALSLGRANPAPTQSIYIGADPQGDPLRGMKTNAEQIGTFRNHAEPCGYFRMGDVVSLHCLSGRIAILVHKECILTDGRMVILYRTHVK